MKADSLKEKLINVLRSLIRLIFGRRCITLKGDSGQPFSFSPYEYPSLLLGVKNTYAQPYHKWSRLLKSGDVVLDVGANIGLATQAFYSILKGNCRIYAFEPIPRNFKLLEANCRALNSDNITTVNSAVGDYDGEAVFYDNVDSGALSRFVPTLKPDYDSSSDWQNYSKVKVKMSRLDTLFKETGLSPSFVKLDVEGSGGLALKGMAETLKNHKPVFICEFHSTEEKQGIMSSLKGAGYKGILFRDDGSVVWCEVEDSEGEFIHPDDPRCELVNIDNQ